ncbi:TIGR03986 family CRISPR-associated RAMP protein [bacterium]|nr:TIGR03986 family CRISPR-associated RAMP protein [bacterium]
MKGYFYKISGQSAKIKGDDGKMYGVNQKYVKSGSLSDSKRFQEVEFNPDGEYAADVVILDTVREVNTPPRPAPQQPMESSNQPRQNPQSNRGPERPHNQSPGGVHSFLNPYNFVRFITKGRPSDSVLGNVCPPPHDRYLGLSGEIVCALKAVTPLFVSDSHAIEDRGGKHFSYRFFELDGNKPALPASSLRGMLRSVFETVTNSCMPVFDGSGFEFRKGGQPKGLIPARVVRLTEEGADLELLDCVKQEHLFEERARSNNRPLSIMNAGSWTVYKGGFNKVLGTDRRTGNKVTFRKNQSEYPAPFKSTDHVAALVRSTPSIKMKYNRRSGGQVPVYKYYEVVEVRKAEDHAKLIESGDLIKVFGYVHYTGPNIENKHDERLFFRWDDRSVETPGWGDIPETARLPKEGNKSLNLDGVGKKTLQEYQNHVSQYWENHKSVIEDLDKRDWPVNEKDLPHPSNFIRANLKLKEGDLVYYIPNSELDIPLLRPILISKLPYRYSREDLLDKNELFHLHTCKKFDSLCPACRTFGWVKDKPENEREIAAYAGRVTLSSAMVVEGADNKIDEDIPLAILGSPKPTKTQFYLLNGNGQPDSRVDYNDATAKLRGRKFYRHHGKLVPQEYKRPPKDGEPVRDKFNRTVQGVRDKGTQFKFSIRFENLAPLELGALLYSIRLESGMFHRIGYGKPLGFGSVQITIEELNTIDWRVRLQSLDCEAGMINAKERIDSWIVDFKEEMKNLYPGEFEQMLADLRAILSLPANDLPIHYPRPGKEPAPDGKQFEWFMKNKEQTLSLPQDDEGLYISLRH